MDINHKLLDIIIINQSIFINLHTHMEHAAKIVTT